jgi:hypothetical protein
MPRDRPSGGGLAQLAVQSARTALRNGDPDAALKWLLPVPPHERPTPLEAEIRYAIAKIAAANLEWGRCERELEAALRLDPTPFYQRRLEHVRRRDSLLDDATWRMVRQKVDPAQRLPSDWLAPTVSTVWTCGAYHSRGHGRGMPWSRLLREAKNPPRDGEERAVILKVTCGFLCRHIVADTPLLRHVDVVVAIPPDPERYAQRGMSLPDNLATAAERQLALLWPMEALVKTKSVELRGLSWTERRQAIKGSMEVKDGAFVKNGSVMLVDDVTTSGATLAEAATLLRAVGARDVHAITLCHTEG